MRAEGNYKSAVVSQLISIVLNTATDLLFTLAFRWGVIGAAVSTMLSDVFTLLLCARLIYRKYPQLHLSRADFRPDIRCVGGIITLSVPMGVQQSIVQVGNLLVQTVVMALALSPLRQYSPHSLRRALCVWCPVLPT